MYPPQSSAAPELSPFRKSFKNHLDNHLPAKGSNIAADPRFWMLAALLFLPAIFIFYPRLTSPQITHLGGHHRPFTYIHNSTRNWRSRYDDPECGSGRVFVYDLPSEFTSDQVLQECEDLEQWRWQCGIGTNDGYGKRSYELVGMLPEEYLPAWYRTNQFALELIFHHRILNYRCRTTDPETATAYYIPFYAGLAVGKFLWIDDIPKREYHVTRLVNWITNQTYWKKTNGSDHFIVLGRIAWDFRRLTEPEKKWGSSFLNLPEMQKITRFTLEKPEGVYEDLSLPYPTGFHPESKLQLQRWQNFVRGQNRTSLFSFIGGSHGKGLDNDFRSTLVNYCNNETAACQLVDCAITNCNNGSAELLKTYLSSHFCLQPKGDSYTRRGVFDCMVAGSVPVFFWNRTAYSQYQWFLPGNPKSYSVFIDNEEVLQGKLIRKVLEGVSKKRLMKMREKVIQTIPNIAYSRPNDDKENIGDAFDIAVEGVLGRFKYEKMWDEEWKHDDDEDKLSR